MKTCTNPSMVMLPKFIPVLLLVAAVSGTEKQIKLEDIEKDNLRADQQAKLEKQYQQYQQQYQSTPFIGAYQTANNYPSPVNFQAAGFSYPPQGLSYQPQQQQHQAASPYAPLVLPYNPQQYLQQSVYQNPYSQLSSNALGAGFQQPHGPVHPLQAYLSQQLAQGVHGGHPGVAVNQQHPLVMTYANPALAGLSQQAAAYYQGLGNLQLYMAGQPGTLPPFYYPGQQDSAHPIPSNVGPTSSPLIFSQQDIPPFQPITHAKLSNYPDASRQQFGISNLASAYTTPSPYTQPQIFTNTEVPNYLSSYKSNVASVGQQQKYFEAIASTISPLQSKYLNSPQYLAQNYNTIQSTHLLPKSAYAGVKSTVSPPIKVAPQSGFSSSSNNGSGSGSSSSSSSSGNSGGSSFQQYRSISGK